MNDFFDLSVFSHPEFGNFRIVIYPGREPLFVGRDVAAALGYRNSYEALARHVDPADRVSRQITTIGQRRRVTLVNESGVYSLALSSRLEGAMRFRHWVTSVVLPQVSRTGGYIPLDTAPGPEGEAVTAERAMEILSSTLRMKEELIEAQRPLVRFAEAVTSAEGSILIRDLAKLITQNGVPVGQARLFGWLRRHGYLFRRERRPIQKWVERGLFDTTVGLVATADGVRESLTTKVTPRGQRYFIEGFLGGRFQLP